MAQADAGALPVGGNDRPVGMVRDRDIAARAMAQGKGSGPEVREAMTPEVRYCFEDGDLDQAARRMAERQVRRLPVMNRDKRLVGILPPGDVVVGEGPRLADGVSRPGGARNRTDGERTGPGA